MSKVKSDNFIVIQGFMVNDLRLKGNELLIYAIIYGFSQAEEQVFSGSQQYLADWTNSTRQGVNKALKSLVDKGLLIKNDKLVNGVKFVEYLATKFTPPSKQSLLPSEQSLLPPSKQSLHNNININNIDNNINNNIGRFKPPTLEEVKAYCKERNNSIDAQHFIDYYTSNGWKVGKNKMKDWRATVRTWERNGFSKPTKKAVINQYDDSLDGIL